MNPQKPFMSPMLLLAVGLLLVVLPLLINEFIKVPDFLRGALTGAGLVLEIAGVAMQRQGLKTAVKSPGAGPKV